MLNTERTLRVQSVRIIPAQISIVTFQVSMVTTHNLSEGNRNVRSASLNERIPRDTSLFSLLAFEILSCLHHRNYCVFLNSDRQKTGDPDKGVGGEGERVGVKGWQRERWRGRWGGGGRACPSVTVCGKKPPSSRLRMPQPDLIY